jgi:hypothetical protein
VVRIPAFAQVFNCLQKCVCQLPVFLASSVRSSIIRISQRGCTRARAPPNVNTSQFCCSRLRPAARKAVSNFQRSASARCRWWLVSPSPTTLLACILSALPSLLASSLTTPFVHTHGFAASSHTYLAPQTAASFADFFCQATAHRSPPASVLVTLGKHLRVFCVQVLILLHLALLLKIFLRFFGHQ